MNSPVMTGRAQQTAGLAQALEAVVYTPMETAKLLKIGRTKMYELIHDKEIQVIRIGRKILIPTEFIQLFLEKQFEVCYNQNENPPCCKKGA